MSAAPWRPLLRTLCATAGRAAAQRALPLYLGLWIVASVLLEGNGVRPADVIAHLQGSPGDLLLAYAGWSVLSMPALRALWSAPASLFLRTLPIPRWQMMTCLAGGSLVAELPWAYLWLRGGGLALGVAHVTAALAVTTLLLARLTRPIEALAAALLAGLVASRAPWPALLVVSLPAAALGARSVWLRAPEPRTRPARVWIGRSASVALATCYALLLWRRARAQLVRSLALTLLALAVSYFALRNNPPDGGSALLTWALATMSGWLLLALASLVGPLLHAEVELCWLLMVCGTPGSTLQVARVAPLAACGAALATLHAAALGAALALSPRLRAVLWLAELLAALLLALLVLGIARWAIRGDGNDPGRLVLGIGITLLGTTAVVARLGVAGLWLWAAAAAVLTALQPWKAGSSAWALRTRLER